MKAICAEHLGYTNVAFIVGKMFIFICYQNGMWDNCNINAPGYMTEFTKNIPESGLWVIITDADAFVGIVMIIGFFCAEYFREIAICLHIFSLPPSNTTMTADVLATHQVRASAAMCWWCGIQCFLMPMRNSAMSSWKSIWQHFRLWGKK